VDFLEFLQVCQSPSCSFHPFIQGRLSLLSFSLFPTWNQTGISAIIFQLPLQLVLFELHQVEQEHKSETTDNEEPSDKPAQEQPLEGGDEVKGGDEELKIDPNKWMRLGKKLVRNPVIDALLIGLVLTLSTAGPRFLNASSTDYVPGFAYIATTTKWFNDTLLPLSMFMVGLTLHQQKECLRLPCLANLLYIIAKLVVIPTVMLGLAKAFQLTDVAGRAAVLISCMPVVAAAFPLGSHYKIGEVVLADNILLGTILLIPTVLLWNLFLDAVKVFPIP
jgi:predicted permease